MSCPQKDATKLKTYFYMNKLNIYINFRIITYKNKPRTLCGFGAYLFLSPQRQFSHREERHSQSCTAVWYQLYHLLLGRHILNIMTTRAIIYRPWRAVILSPIDHLMHLRLYCNWSRLQVPRIEGHFTSALESKGLRQSVSLQIIMLKAPIPRSSRVDLKILLA